MTTTIIISLASLISGFFMGYWTSYYKTKGKNRAMLEDTAGLTEEKEKVAAKYHLDSSKKKYKYEMKKELYLKYFALIDQLGKESNKATQDKILPAITEFQSGLINANGNQQKQNKTIADFSAVINSLMLEAHQSLVNVKQETNGLKLVASERFLELLKEMDQAYESNLDLMADYSKILTALVLTENESEANAFEKQLDESSQKIIFLRDELYAEMKRDLDNI